MKESKRFSVPHSWEVTPQQAVAIQQDLRKAVVSYDQLEAVITVGGVDVGFDAEGLGRAAVVVLQLDTLELLDCAMACRKTKFPYVPGLLSFREAPLVLEAIEKLGILPDLLLCDGHGMAHPRRFGIACHLGVLTGLPTIGVGKSRLVGRHDFVETRRGAWQPLVDGEQTIGAAVCTRAGIKPVYVSIGHRISLATAIHYTLRCTSKFRLPETTRLAHRLASLKGTSHPDVSQLD